jgi:hypothetical protein
MISGPSLPRSLAFKKYLNKSSYYGNERGASITASHHIIFSSVSFLLFFALQSLKSGFLSSGFLQLSIIASLLLKVNFFVGNDTWQ